MVTNTVIITCHQHLFLIVGVSLMKVAEDCQNIWKIVNHLASGNEPQQCQSYLATQDCSKASILLPG